MVLSWSMVLGQSNQALKNILKIEKNGSSGIREQSTLSCVVTKVLWKKYCHARARMKSDSAFNVNPLVFFSPPLG